MPYLSIKSNTYKIIGTHVKQQMIVKLFSNGVWLLLLFTQFLPKDEGMTEDQSRSTPTSAPPQSKRKSPCAQVISL